MNHLETIKKILITDNSPATLIIRVMVGSIFLSEGFQKFILSDLWGIGRMAEFGLPASDIIRYIVGILEVSCGLSVLFGVFTRAAVVPLIIIMVVALNLIKLPILYNDGIWAMAHAAKIEYAMLMGSIFLLIQGGGKWSLDNYLLLRFQGRYTASISTRNYSGNNEN